MRPGRKPRRPVFSERGLFTIDCLFFVEQVIENMSLILVSDTTDEIIAVRVNKISKKVEQTNELHNEDKPVSEGRKKLDQLGEAIKSLVNVYEHYNVDEVVELMSLAVHKDYRRRGIGLKIMKATLALIKNLDLGGVIVKGEGSGNYVNKIFANAGFDFLGEIVYKDFKVNGKVVFKEMGEHRSTRVFAKFIS